MGVSADRGRRAYLAQGGTGSVDCESDSFMVGRTGRRCCGIQGLACDGQLRHVRLRLDEDEPRDPSTSHATARSQFGVLAPAWCTSHHERRVGHTSRSPSARGPNVPAVLRRGNDGRGASTVSEQKSGILRANELKQLDRELRPVCPVQHVLSTASIHRYLSPRLSAG